MPYVTLYTRGLDAHRGARAADALDEPAHPPEPHHPHRPAHARAARPHPAPQCPGTAVEPGRCASGIAGAHPDHVVAARGGISPHAALPAPHPSLYVATRYGGRELASFPVPPAAGLGV